MTKDNYQSDFLCSFAVPDRNLLKQKYEIGTFLTRKYDCVRLMKNVYRFFFQYFFRSYES